MLAGVMRVMENDRRKTKNRSELERDYYEIDDYLFTRPIIVRFLADGTRPRSRSTGRRKEVKRRDRVRKQRLERWEKEQKSEWRGRGKEKRREGRRRRRRRGGNAGSSGMEIYRFCEEESGSTSGCTCPPGCTCVHLLPAPAYICIPM